MNDIKVLYRLRAPFEEISFRAGSRDNNGTQALAYIDPRDVIHRLDEVVGPINWNTADQVNGLVITTFLHITLPSGKVITRSDGSGIQSGEKIITNHRIPPFTDYYGKPDKKMDGVEWQEEEVESNSRFPDYVKSAYSDSFKRAAMKFGVGLYLYETPTIYASVSYGVVNQTEAKANFLKARPDLVPLSEKHLETLYARLEPDKDFAEELFPGVELTAFHAKLILEAVKWKR